MAKLIVTADVHGSYSTWLTVKALLSSDDSLVVAGDLFDNRYGNYTDSDFKPDAIKDDLKGFKNQFHYVYGNCDVPSFLPGFSYSLEMEYFGKKIVVHHGHDHFSYPGQADMIVTGHTHIHRLEKMDGRIFMNPGSPARPKRNGPVFGVIDQKGAGIIDLKSGDVVSYIGFQAG